MTDVPHCPTHPLTRPDLTDWTRTQVADLLQVEAASITSEENLLESGMDSIRLAHLAQQFRRAGYLVDLIDLAEEPTVAAWADLLAESR